MRKRFLLSLLMASAGLSAQVWQPDLGNGRYRNPVIMADYSDPDVCRVGEDFYMTASSFNCVPALQILHSRDLVNWQITGAASPDHVPGYEWNMTPLYGKGVWAPSIRWHDGRFYIFYGDPDQGIYRLTAEQIEGPWEETLVMHGTGYIDPCPLWDEDGRVWLVHALAGSRAGLKSVLLMAELDSTASKVVSPSRIIFDGHETQPTCEGPKLYKRGGYYYIFHPAGGVRTGWQTVLRSKEIYGPWEEKIVLRQGKTRVNGPHQGAWVTAPDGSDWFLHFQDRGLYGRVVHLQPMRWADDWPVMGRDGEPVTEWKKPVQGEAVQVPATSDEFDGLTLGLQWQWAAQPEPKWWYCDGKNGWLRLYSFPERNDRMFWRWREQQSAGKWLMQPNLLMQKLPAETFTVTVKVRLCPDARYTGEQGGIVFSGKEYHTLALVSIEDGVKVVADEQDSVLTVEPWQWVWLRMECRLRGRRTECRFSVSTDGEQFVPAGKEFVPEQQKESWTGCKAGLYCLRPQTDDKQQNDGGWIDADWWRITE